MKKSGPGTRDPGPGKIEAVHHGADRSHAITSQPFTHNDPVSSARSRVRNHEHPHGISGPGSRVPSPVCCLTIAGSDSGGGAGIQADLKTFAALGVHGVSAITALTAQNTRGVTAVHPVPAKHLRAELDAVFDDFAIAAVKTGMLGDAKTVHCVSRELERRKPKWIVVDPVMIATSGARLLDPDAVRVLIETLFPLADVLTPNLPEAEALTGISIRNAREGQRAAERLLGYGAKSVLLKGGHGRGREAIDRWFDARGMLELSHPRLPGQFHGTGCTLSSALAAELAKGATPRTAVRRAIAFVQRAMRRGSRPGRGNLVVLHV